jgi:[ribosomal protein S18]-alanine N-acetyltransferase
MRQVKQEHKPEPMQANTALARHLPQQPVSLYSGLLPEDMELVDLDRAYADQVIRLEPLVYPKGWSEKLIIAEFDKRISFRPSLVYGGELMAYSFNYIIEDELHILNLAVRPELQHRGVGTFLLATLLSKAEKRGVKFCFLEVRRSNIRAQHLYYKAGFTANGIRRNYYSDNGEDAILMEYHF